MRRHRGGTRQRCEELVDALAPQRCSITTLCTRVAARRGRPIHLLSAALPQAGLRGLTLSTRAADFIFYEVRASPLLGVHIVLHEIAHLALGHCGDRERAAGFTHLMPDLDPDYITSVLGRGCYYTTPEERDAELVASLLGPRIYLAPPICSPTAVSGAYGLRAAAP